MWDCDNCGCQAIAGTITECPVCHTPRNQDVAAEPPVPDASASANAAVEDRKAPQPLDEEIGDTEQGDWGKPNG